MDEDNIPPIQRQRFLPYFPNHMFVQSKRGWQRCQERRTVNQAHLQHFHLLEEVLLSPVSVR